MTAASKSAEKRVWRVGEIVGAVEITKVFEGPRGYRASVARGRCTVDGCWGERPMTHAALLAHANGRAKGCPECRQRNQRKINVPRHNCRVCDDCPALRPADGTPCACGEARQ